MAKGSKRFFSEEKNQKTFSIGADRIHTPGGAIRPGAARRCSPSAERFGTNRKKSFWFFFFRKRTPSL
jgi:hypothetical protein